MSWCSANGICWGSCRSTWTTTTGPGPTYRWPRTHPSHGVCSRLARAVWWRCPAWVGSITNTSGERREPIGRISGRHTLNSEETPMTDQSKPYTPLTTDNSALVLVDHQVGLMTGVRDYETGELKHNVVALAKAAKVLRIPTVVTTTDRDSM